MKQCDVKNCDCQATMFVDDDGVNTWLCEEHYQQLVMFRSKQPEWRGKVNYILYELFPATTGTRIAYFKVANNALEFAKNRAGATQFEKYEDAEKHRCLNSPWEFNQINIRIMEVPK
ncbi:MAG: hypothetical protein PHT77_05450 [Bacteroidales bacterium]|nr:hypothetical protein [Bacteroidales bacterium]